MKKFVSQSNNQNRLLPYCVAVWNPSISQYVPLKGEEYLTIEEADTRAKELNAEYEEECKEEV